MQCLLQLLWGYSMNQPQTIWKQMVCPSPRKTINKNKTGGGLDGPTGYSGETLLCPTVDSIQDNANECSLKSIKYLPPKDFIFSGHLRYLSIPNVEKTN